MDTTSWGKPENAGGGEERAVTFPGVNSGPAAFDTEPSVMILHADLIIAAGLTAVLQQHTGFRIIPTPGPGNFVCGPPLADVIVADYETAIRLAEGAPHWATNLLVFTNCDSEAKICLALESGAKAYLLYGIGVPELFEGIRSVRRGGVAFSPPVAARITNWSKSERLTPRESAVLEQLMLGLSNKVIAHRLNLHVSTVKTHVKAILRKLDAESRTAAVLTAQHRGLL